MIRFLARKMWKNKWMMLSLLAGNLLLVGIVAGTPLYINATLRRILHRDLRQIETQEHPAMLSLRYNFNLIAPENRLQGYEQTRDILVPGLLRDLGIPAQMTLRTDVLSSWHMVPDTPRETTPRVRSLELVGGEGFASRVNITRGRVPADYPVDGNIIEAIAMEATLIRHDLLVGELLEVRNMHYPLYVRIVGIYTLAEGAEYYWAALGLTHQNTLLVSPDLVREHFLAPYHTNYRLLTTWIHLLDFTAMTGRHVPRYINALDTMRNRFNLPVPTWHFTENFSGTITGHATRAERLAITLWVLQIPLYVLLAAYIYMVSRQILIMERNEIAVFKSRGASRRQLLGLYALQGLFVAVVCYPAGLGLGVILSRMLGASSGFLYLVQRAPLPVEITPSALLYAALAMLLSFLTMFLPVIGYSRVSIVDYKRSRTKSSKPLWQRLYLDVLFLGISLYALYAFNAQREVMATMLRETRSVDPLIFAASSLFIMGLGLLCLRFFPYGVRLVYALGRRFWRPAAYASLLKVIRSAGEEQFIMIFLIFTLSVGTFNARAARTLNLNTEHQIQYLAGADLMFREFWPVSRPPPGAPQPAVFTEPDFTRFSQFSEVDALTQVKRQNATFQMEGLSVSAPAELMAIETDSFGQTIWFREDLLGAHINHFLNALAGRPDGVLLSKSFREAGFALGDTITFTGEHGDTARASVVGFVSHWPGFAPFSPGEADSGAQAEARRLIIANLGHLQTTWGIQPYQVWMNTNTASNEFFHTFARENRLWLVEFYDAEAAVVESRNEPILQGTNGVLTVGFLVSLLICIAGFLIYWILSIRSRVLQFGVFRAMGMEMRELVGILITEQVLITLTAIGLGAAVGEIAARLFVPLIQISYTAADRVIPLKIVTEARDYANLYSVIGVMIVLCVSILVLYVSRIKITQALKLGED